eukprot:6014162-Amphidinium_carterae.1
MVADSSVPSSSPFDVRKKDSPDTLEGEIERMVVQKKQKREVRERVRSGKAVKILDRGEGTSSEAVWEVECREAIYEQHTYAAFPGCSPAPHSGVPCVRLVVDGFASKQELQQMKAAVDGALSGLFHQGLETLLVPEASAKNRLGHEGFRLTAELLSRAKGFLASA